MHIGTKEHSQTRAYKNQALAKFLLPHIDTPSSCYTLTYIVRYTSIIKHEFTCKNIAHGQTCLEPTHEL